jgi:hypothetical protein
MSTQLQMLMNQAGTDVSGKWMNTSHAAKFAELIVAECIWAFGQTRQEPSLQKYVLQRLGIEQHDSAS